MEYLRGEFQFNAVDVSEGQGLPDKLLYVTDIYTLRPRLGALTRELKKAVRSLAIDFR